MTGMTCDTCGSDRSVKSFLVRPPLRVLEPTEPLDTLFDRVEYRTIDLCFNCRVELSNAAIQRLTYQDTEWYQALCAEGQV